MSGPLIVAARLGADDFSWLEGLRKTHYPPARNRVPAHLTLFHALPPSAEREVRSRLAALAGEASPKAWIDGLLDLGGGVALRVVSPELDRIRAELASDLHGLLSAQDRAGWRPHVTIQNKVSPRDAQALRTTLEPRIVRRPLAVTGLDLHRYEDGPWGRLATYAFRGIR